MALPDPFSIEEGAVCFSGRALKGADASTFEVLAGGAYARDKDAVYLVMQKKVKALKGPDPASFEALGGDYGRDASHVYFEGKRVRLKKGAGRREAFRWLGSCYGADGSWMYFGTQQCAPPEGVDLDWARLRHRPFTENKVNRSDAVLSDGVHHFFRLWRLGWVPVDGFEFDNVEPIETSEGYRGVHEYLGDGARVWCAGVLLEGADAARARVVGFNALDDGEAVYGGHHRLEFAPGSLAWVGDDLFRTEDALFSMNREGVPKEVAKLESAWEAPSVEFAFQALVDAIWPDAFHVLDRYLPVEAMPMDMEFPNDVDGGPPALIVEAKLPGGLLSVRPLAESGKAGTQEAELPTISVRASAWMTLFSTAWCRHRGRAGSLRAYANYGGMYPDADPLHVKLCQRAVPAAVDLIAALYAEGQAEEAAALWFLLQFRARAPWQPRDGEGELLQLLPRVPFELIPRAIFERPQDSFTVTTHLGVAKQIAAQKLLSAADFRTRWCAANLACGILIDSNKTPQCLTLLVDPLVAQLKVETIGILRELLLGVLEAAAVAASVSADIARSFPYAELERVSAALEEHGVNASIQRVRRVEALFGQGRFAESDALLETLQDEVGPAPGPYVHRVRYASHEAAAVAGQVRALLSPAVKPDAKEVWMETLRDRLKALGVREADAFGPMEKRDDLADALADLVRFGQ